MAETTQITSPLIRNIDTPVLTIIIVSFNTKRLTLECINSVYKETKKIRFEIIIIDNASTDGSSEAVKKLYPDIRMIESQKNEGFARANNIAAALARGKYILLLNPDTVVISSAIDKLVQFAEENKEAKIWGGKTTFADGTLNPSCLGQLTPWTLFCRASGLTWIFPRSSIFNREYIHKWSGMKTAMSVDIVVGCFLLITKEFWEELGGFDRRFFMYGEEADLCLRAAKKGASPRVTPTATIIHHGGASETSNEEKLIKILKGQVTLMIVHWPKSWQAYGRFMLCTMVRLRAIANAYIRVPMRQGQGKRTTNEPWSKAYQKKAEWINGWSE
jgi:GT2 family glycosyltransferase